MLRLVVISCALAACLAQNVDPKNARILKEQRFNAGDGRTGAAFATEDGVIFREESDQDGNRVGQYSYIGEDGTTYTVKYVAGKDGFRILDGAHIPSGGQDAAAFGAEDLEEEELAAPLTQVPVVAPNAAPVPLPAAIPDYDDEPVDPNFNPFINPHDPTHRNFQFNSNAAKFNPESPLAQQQSLVPDCADCAGVNPFVNPFDASHQQGGLLAGHLAGFGVPQQQAARPAAPRSSLPSLAPAAPATPRPVAVIPTTTGSPRFFPPGQIKLNRFETGFNFDFES